MWYPATTASSRRMIFRHFTPPRRPIGLAPRAMLRHIVRVETANQRITRHEYPAMAHQ